MSHQQIADDIMVTNEAIEAQRLHVREFSPIKPNPDIYGAFIKSAYMVSDIHQCSTYQKFSYLLQEGNKAIDLKRIDERYMALGFKKLSLYKLFL